MTGSDALVSRTLRTRLLVLVAALLAALGVLSLIAVHAEAVPLAGSSSPLPGSMFEGGDGNQEPSTALRKDWQNSLPVGHSPDPNANDNIFAGGSEGKENNPGNWAFVAKDGGSTPGKNNILDAYSLNDPVSNQVFLHLAFTRGDDTGTTFMAFELNKRADLWNNGKANIPCRTTGDLIVSLQVSGNDPDVILQKWTTTGAVDPVSGCAKTGNLTDFTAFTDNVDAQGAVNDGPIQNYLPASFAWPGNTISANLFGEASLNLSTLLKDALGTPCFSFGSIWMHTRASTSDSSNLDDYIAPRPLIVRNCSASGTKFHDLNANGVKDAGEPGLAGFRMWADYDNDGVRDAGEPFDDTDANGDYVIENVQDPSGTYSIREQLTPPATGTGGWTCSFPATTGSNGDFPCSHNGIDGATTPNATGMDFGNYKQATIKVEKQTVPGGAAGPFAFTSSIPGKPSFSLGDDGVETTAVAPGVYTATETPHPDFNLTDITCSGDTVAPLSSDSGATATFDAQSGETITCVFTNTRKQGQLTVRKVLDPTTDPGKFDLKIGSDVVVDDGGHLAEGTRTLDTGTSYTVSETSASLAKYDSSIECKDGATIVASGSGTSLSSVPVVEGHNVVCTFTNVRRPGSIKVVKDLIPADDAGRFDLKVGSTVVKAAAGDGGQGTTSVAPGTYTVSEVGAGGTDLAKYDKSIACTRNGQPAESGSGASLGGVAVDSDDEVVCTITNTRRNGKLTVVKDLAPNDDPGRFDLRIGDDVVKAGAADGESGSKSVPPGDYDVSELGAGGTSLAKYDSSVSCDNGQSGSGAALADVRVDSNDDVTCTITNARRKGSLTVVKDLLPSDDPGRFDLRIGDEVVKAAAGDGGSGSRDLAPGDYTVSELGAGGTDLSKYDKSIACTRNGEQAESGAGASLGGVTVDSNDEVVCTITNARRKGSLTVVKDLVPNDDPGRFDLRIDDEVVKSEAGDGGSGSRDLAPGTYTVSEVAHAGTSLASYDASVECVKNGQAGLSGQGSSLGGVTVDSNDVVVCTITNTRRAGSIKVIKQLVPAHDDGTFDLKVGADVVKAAAGDGDAGIKSVAPGEYSVSEAGAGGTSLDDYDSSVACDKNGQAYKSADGSSIAGLAVGSDDEVVCTITNTRLGTVKVEKQTDPATADSFHFGSSLPGGGFDLADDQVQTVGHVLPGTYTVTEDDPTPAYDLTGVACDDGQSASVSTTSTADRKATIKVDPGETVRCVFTNTKRGSVTVEKTEAGSGELSRSWSFRLSGNGIEPITKSTADGNPMAFGDLEPGDYTLCEIGMPIDWRSSLENPPYDGERTEEGGTAQVCVTIEIEPGEAESIAVDNTRPSTLVIKEGDILVHHGDTITYTFDVLNSGNAPLENVSVEDDRCDDAPVRDAAHDTNADGDALLEPAGTPDATQSERWRFTCTSVVPADHAGDEENPIVNVATAHAFDQAGNEVTDTDDHATRIIHPGIAVDKTLRRGGEGSYGEGPISVHVGDTIEYRFAVTNEGDTPLTVKFSDPRCDDEPDAPESGDDGDAQLEVGETWIYRCSHLVTGEDDDPLQNTVTVTGTDQLGGDRGTVTDSDTEEAAILKPGTLVVKEGNQFAYPGETVTFTFAVTNDGNAPLSDVTVTDDRCAPVTGPTQKLDGDQDALLEVGEKWIFTCSKQIPAGHKIGDENPIRNVATVTGKDPLGKTVSDDDDHLVRVLHPAIDIEKTGPAAAMVGDPLAYTLTVTNPGDVPFAAQEVGVTDPRCEQPPAGPNTGSDATPGRLDPGDTWTYTCTAQTAGQPAGTFVNTATVTAKDFNGRQVTDTDDFPTVLEVQAVLAAQPGSARLSGPSGCVRKPFKVVVRGAQIQRVTFYRDGKRIKRIAAKPGQRTFKLRVGPGKREGVHRITARVEFLAVSGTQARTLRLSYQRCKRQVVRPRFTG